jgi:hypothetical protein
VVNLKMSPKPYRSCPRKVLTRDGPPAAFSIGRCGEVVLQSFPYIMFKPINSDCRDFDITPFGDKLWLIYIRSGVIKDSNEFGLASSEDGYNWQEEGVVMKPRAGSWDSRSLWAMHVSTTPGGFVMYYSALGEGMRLHQSIGQAYSEDLRMWDRSDNPLLTLNSENEYYDNSTKKIGRYDKVHELPILFRDPWSFSHNGKNYLIFAARDKQVVDEHNACVGLAELHPDGSVTYLPSIYSPRTYQEIECPAIYFFEGQWFLLFCEDIVVQMRYAVADDPFTGFTEPQNNILAPAKNYVGRIVTWQGKYLFFYHTPEKILADPKIVN